ncbi:hypothetical protein B0H10DRAFT_2435980 [Mycena sp. CBHHK59/15]|nr:hypothetical protein B0H10DRAFT_2435980 [Mycena sp. CBHHK59/15]
MAGGNVTTDVSQELKLLAKERSASEAHEKDKKKKKRPKARLTPNTPQRTRQQALPRPEHTSRPASLSFSLDVDVGVAVEDSMHPTPLLSPAAELEEVPPTEDKVGATVNVTCKAEEAEEAGDEGQSTESDLEWSRWASDRKNGGSLDAVLGDYGASA